MRSVTVYSSAPLGTQLACAFQNLSRLGLRVVVQPLSALPATPHPGRRRSALRDELLAVSQRLATIGERLTQGENLPGWLDAGTENGLRAERDSLQSRQRAIQQTLKGAGRRAGIMAERLKKIHLELDFPAEQAELA